MTCPRDPGELEQPQGGGLAFLLVVVFWIVVLVAAHFGGVF